MVDEVGKTFHLDAKVPDQRLSRITVGVRCRDGVRSPKTDERLSLVVKLIPFRMPAEVVMIVEEENRLFRSQSRTIEVRGGKAGNACPHDNQVIVLGDAYARRNVLVFASCDRVELGNRCGVISTKSGAQRRRRRVATFLLWGWELAGARSVLMLNSGKETVGSAEGNRQSI